MTPLILTLALLAQVPNAENAARMAAGQIPVYRVSVTSRDTKAINYRHRSGATKIDFQGTELMPRASGEAKVESKQGYIEIEVEFDELSAATTHGSEHLTYVLWAITPEGRASNLGEILLNGNRGKLNVTTKFQVFGLIVTAEPYFAVSMPSDTVVMENIVRSGTKGAVEVIDAKYELLQRGQYAPLANPLALQLDKKLPLELYEARNAVQIARASGAEQHASDTFQKAVATLGSAEAEQARDAKSKAVARFSREAVQTAEDSRLISVKRQEENALEAERLASISREASANAAAVSAEAETDRVRRAAEAASANAANEAERQARDAASRNELARMEAAKLRLKNEALREEGQAEAERIRRESEAKLAAANAEAARLQADNLAQKAAYDLEAARQLSAQTALRAKLLDQFNAVLQTRETARGLIVNLSDVLFDTGRSTLRPAAREKLARLTGILASNPGLTMAIEGHTDNVGTNESNMKLSNDRASSVRDFLSNGGIPSAALSTHGFGEEQPVSSNNSAAGRQENRRVEMVVAGEVIGIGKIQK